MEESTSGIKGFKIKVTGYNAIFSAVFTRGVSFYELLFALLHIESPDDCDSAFSHLQSVARHKRSRWTTMAASAYQTHLIEDYKRIW